MSAEDLYYRVSRAGRVDDSIRALAVRAAAAGQLAEYRDSIRLILNWLRADPETFGVPFRDHVHAGQTEYIGFTGPVSVRYSIHPPTKCVYLLTPLRLSRQAGF